MSFGQHPGRAVQNSIGLADRNTLFKEDARRFLFQRDGTAQQHSPEQACPDCDAIRLEVGSAGLLAE
jgi:hypothetical protein